ncbi:MAG: ABC transporter permease [Sedimentisphaerales bacterium]|nr:ABC transporter permease [Sedimentisphaerales bacterium]
MVWFRIKRTIKLGAKSLWMHRLRSTLTTLGIVFGVCSVIAMLAIGEGASQEAQNQIARLGSRNVIIKTVKPAEEQQSTADDSTMKTYGLTYEDAERFRATLSYEVIVPSRRINQQVWYRNRKVTVEVIGTIPWYPEIAPIEIMRGRFFGSIDLHYQHKVCIVDESVIDEIFIIDDPIGQDIKIKDNYYRVVGIVTAVGPIDTTGETANGIEPQAGPSRSGEMAGGIMGNVYIPLSAFKSSFGEISIQMTAGTRQMEKVELQEVTVKVPSLDMVLPTRDILEDMLASTHKKKDYQILVPLELLRQAARTKRIFSIVLGSIAAISLLVGGIGIMNIMLATVSERTREIGIRRALGARRRDIIIQFLSETVMLTLTGGVLGIALGSLIPYLVERFFYMPTVITGFSLILAFGISGAIGVAFGIYPAYRAAWLDPIESLRHE